MTAISCKSSALSSFYKKDYVLYEIQDQRGILRSNSYEPWKAEVIADLEISGFIRSEGDKYVLTKEGKEVINYDSFLYYNRKFNLQKTDEVLQEIVEGKSSRFGAFLLFLSLLFACLLILGSRWPVLSFLFS